MVSNPGEFLGFISMSIELFEEFLLLIIEIVDSLVRQIPTGKSQTHNTVVMLVISALNPNLSVGSKVILEGFQLSSEYGFIGDSYSLRFYLDS